MTLRRVLQRNDYKQREEHTRYRSTEAVRREQLVSTVSTEPDRLTIISLFYLRTTLCTKVRLLEFSWLIESVHMLLISCPRDYHNFRF